MYRQVTALVGFHWRLLSRDPISVCFGVMFPLIFIVIFLAMPEIEINGRTVSGIAFGIPSLVLFSLMSLALSATAAPLTSLREQGTLRSLSVLGVSRLKFILAIVPSRLAVAALQITLSLGLGMALVNNFHVRVSVLIFGSLLAIVVTQSIGIFLGGLSGNMGLISGLSGALTPVLLILSGILLSPGLLPSFIESTHKFNPLAMLGDMLRHATIGTDLTYSIWRTSLSCLVFAVTMIMISAVTFRWQDSE